jgi:hypothetical protein
LVFHLGARRGVRESSMRHRVSAALRRSDAASRAAAEAGARRAVQLEGARGARAALVGRVAGVVIVVVAAGMSRHKRGGGGEAASARDELGDEESEA